MGHKKIKDKNEKPECALAEEVMSEIFNETKKRRIIARKPDNEVVFEIPTIGFIALTGILLFFFPLFVIAVIAAYKHKIQLEVIRDLTDEEAQQLNSPKEHNTMIGVQYEPGDGYATVIQ